MTQKRQPVDYAAQVAARRAAMGAAADTPAAPTPPQNGGHEGTHNGEVPAGAPVVAQEQKTSENGSGSHVQTTPNGPDVDEQSQHSKEVTTLERPIGESADTPLPKKKVDRQGIDLRPVDRERWERFEMFCLRRRMRLGKKKGLSLYARAGLQLLDELLTRDETAAEALLRSIGESERRETT